MERQQVGGSSVQREIEVMREMDFSDVCKMIECYKCSIGVMWLVIVDI